MTKKENIPDFLGDIYTQIIVPKNSWCYWILSCVFWVCVTNVYNHMKTSLGNEVCDGMMTTVND